MYGDRTGLPEISAFTREALSPRADSPVTATYAVGLDGVRRIAAVQNPGSSTWRR